MQPHSQTQVHNHIQSQITFTIDPPQLRSTAASKHHEYHIHGHDSIGQYDVWRRYSDFIILKQHMMNRWPGVYVPALPEKKYIGNNQALFLQFRRDGLEKFLAVIKQSQWLWYGDEFQLFIKSKSNEVDKFLSNLGKTNNRQISTKYRSKFAQILNPENAQTGGEDSHKISQFRNYIKNSLTILQKLSKVSQAMVEDRKKYAQKYETLLTNILPTYEQQCISEYSNQKQKLWFCNFKSNGLGESQGNMDKLASKNAPTIISELVKQEIRELNNFLDILKNKEEYQSMKIKALSKKKDLELEESKINMGKESLFNKIKKASKEEMLQQVRMQLQKANEQLKDAQQICIIIDRLLANDQIKMFKDVRQKGYYRIVKDLAKVQRDSYDNQIEFWSKIAGGDTSLEVLEKHQHKKQSIQARPQMITSQQIQQQHQVLQQLPVHPELSLKYQHSKQDKQNEQTEESHEKTEQEENKHEKQQIIEE